KIGSWLLVLGLFGAGVGGAFAPWIWRESVALKLTAPGLAEYVKFLPEIRTLQLQINRLHFLYPLFVVMLALPLVAVNRQLRLPTWLRWLLRLTVLPFALASLSPIWDPAILFTAEFRTQTILAGIAIGLTVVAPLFKNLSLKLLLAALSISSLIALILAYRLFIMVQAPIAATYNGPVGLSWGWDLTVAGLIIGVGAGLASLFGPRRRARKVNGNDK
ncbi:MAG: hypothetical protein R3264_14180, partial [Anaerolineae bacterium]|nr:hypothetical protein [Anaerolineae bacterium]